LQQTNPDARYKAECRLGDIDELRLQALHQRRQVGVRLRPKRVQLRPDQRPVRHGFNRWRTSSEFACTS